MSRLYRHRSDLSDPAINKELDAASIRPWNHFSTIPANVYVEELSGFDLCTLREQAIQTY